MERAAWLWACKCPAVDAQSHHAESKSSQVHAPRSAPKKLPRQFPCMALMSDTQTFVPPLFPKNSCRDQPRSLRKVLCLRPTVPSSAGGRDPDPRAAECPHPSPFSQAGADLDVRVDPVGRMEVGCCVRPGSASVLGTLCGLSLSSCDRVGVPGGQRALHMYSLSI